MTRHVSPELLALHREGAVTAAKAASIDGHLAGCPRCSGIDAALTNLPSVLAATELPPMPDALTLRIQMAIARESAARAEASSASSAPAPAPAEAGVAGADPRAAGAVAGTARARAGSAGIPGRPDLPERRRSRSRRFRRPDWSSPLLLRGLAAAAVVVVIAGAGILFANVHTASQPAGSTANGAGARAPAARPSAAGGVSRQGSFGARASVPMTVSYRLNGRIATTYAVVSHGNFTPKSLPRMVRKQVASVTKLGSGVSGLGYQGAASQRSRIGGVSMSALQGCLSVMARGRRVLLVDVARFLGRPATMVVLKSLTAANVFDVGIMGTDCSASNLDIIRMLRIPVR